LHYVACVTAVKRQQSDQEEAAEDELDSNFSLFTFNHNTAEILAKT